MLKILILLALLCPGAALSEDNIHYVKGMELLDDDKYREAEKELLSENIMKL